MNARTFRRIALGLDGAIEGAHMGHPDFRAHGRIFASLDAEEIVGMVTLTPEQQHQFVEQHPTVFFPAAGAWGRQGCTHVKLAAANEETVGEAMTLAWRNSAEKRKARGAKKRR